MTGNIVGYPWTTRLYAINFTSYENIDSPAAYPAGARGPADWYVGTSLWQSYWRNRKWRHDTERKVNICHRHSSPFCVTQSLIQAFMRSGTSPYKKQRPRYLLPRIIDKECPFSWSYISQNNEFTGELFRSFSFVVTDSRICSFQVFISPHHESSTYGTPAWVWHPPRFQKDFML